MSKEIFIFFAVLCMTFVFCHRNPSDFNGMDEIEIDIPMNQTCIYAQAMFSGQGDSSELMSLRIYSIRFDEKWNSNDTLFCRGIIIRYSADGLPSSGNYPSVIIPYTANPDTGELLLSIDKEWVMFQYSELLDAGPVFLKRDAAVDTTSEPTLSFNQFPIFPGKMKPNTGYSIYRPGDKADYNFLPVERIFQIGQSARWNDPYGDCEGLSFSVDHTIADFDTMRYEGIIDEHGIVISRYSDEILVTSAEYSEGCSSYKIEKINRRIADYSDPKTLHDLPWYAELVISQGFSVPAE